MPAGAVCERMADDKRGREKQARDAENRQDERDIIAALEREDETEPPLDPSALTDFEADLDGLSFPATGAEVVDAVGDHPVESDAGTHTVADLVPETDAAVFDDPETVRLRVQRPTVAAAMKRLVEASETLQQENLQGSQRKAYEKTLRELRGIDADDDDEGVQVITDWIVERIHEKEKLPGSRAVRREAAKFCRANGYEVRNDEWLGI